jgi:hypothetical protein
VLKRLGLWENDSQIGGLFGVYVDLTPQGSVFRSAYPNDSSSFGETKFNAANNLSSYKPAFYSVPGWLMLGVIREDDVPFDAGARENTPQDEPNGPFTRVFNHFFDPWRNQQLLGIPLWTRASDWALNDDLHLVSRENDFRLSRVRETMWRALTLKTIDTGGNFLDLPFAPNDAFGIRTREDLRKVYWAGAFRGLGDVLHLLEDMAQPQHTRDDPHSGLACVSESCHPLFGHASYFEAVVEARATGAKFFTLRERFFEDHLVVETTPLVSGPPLTFGSLPAVPFNIYSDYFATATGGASTTGKGLANYSNNGFYTAGTNIGVSVYPTPDGAALHQVDLPAGTAINAAGFPVPGVLSLIKGDVPDAAGLDATATDVSLSSFGAFDEFLRPLSKKQYSLNHYNYDDQARLLVPRAVAYSAGLLNYFFRGKMEIGLPDEGVYGIVDHASLLPPNPAIDPLHGFKGFHRIRLKLTNTTADVTPLGGAATPQRMPGGTLVAVFKFKRNNCYRDDLNGEITDQAQWTFCHSDEEEIAVSKPNAALDRSVPLASEAPTGKEFTFEFDNELPINAWDVTLQVVYRGTLGAENDAVVVATKDISEPSYLTLGNYSDYNLLNGGFHTGAEIASDDALWNALNPACRDTTHGPRRDACVNIPLTLSLTFGTAQAPVVVKMRKTLDHDWRVAGRHFARIAVLGDVPPFNQPPKTVHAVLGFDNPPFFLDGDPAFDLRTYEVQQKDPVSRTIGVFAPSRGVRFWDGVFFLMDGSTAAATFLPDVHVLDSDPLVGDERLPSPVEITGWDPP